MPDARASLGETLLLLGRIREAKGKFEKALKSEPRNVNALLGSAQLAQMEGRFEEATAIYGRILAIHPKIPRAWAALVGLCKMTAADGDWLETAEEIAASGLAPLDESDMRFAIGKYFDDIKDYADAFENYQRANELRKTAVARYVPEERTQFVDTLIRPLHARENRAGDRRLALGKAGIRRRDAALRHLARRADHRIPPGRASARASCCSGPMRRASTEMPSSSGVLDEPTRKKLAERYLRVLGERNADALRVVDKAPFN